MNVTKVYFARVAADRGFYVSCTVEVPGLGELELKDCLSKETMERVSIEVMQVTRIRLGMPLVTNSEGHF